MALGILGFNLGIETMQLAVVLATLPWLLLLSTTRLYPAFRVFSAGFAAVAAVGWMAEQALDWSNPIGPVVDDVAAHALWVVVLLATVSMVAKAVQVAAAWRHGAALGLQARRSASARRAYTWFPGPP